MNKSTRNIVPPALIEVTRGEQVESSHRAHVCVMDSSGKKLFSLGDPRHRAFLRSSAKPLQAAAVILSGAAEAFELTDRELAVISGSHGGEDIHVKIVRSILKKADLDQDALQCGIHFPLDASVRSKLQKSKQKPSPLHHNCSGKHAGMLLTAKHFGKDIDNYLDKAHPVQQQIIRLIARASDVPTSEVGIGIDGCSAPVHSIPLQNAALAYARMIDRNYVSDYLAGAFKTITDSMRSFPELVAANQDRLCTELIRAGMDFELIAKAGAEGYYATAWRDPESGKGIGMTLKVEDGSQRGRDPLVVKLLRLFSVLPDVLPESLKQFAERPITNHTGTDVGTIRVRV